MATGTEAYSILDNVTRIIGKHTLEDGYCYRLDHASYKSDDPTTLELSWFLDPESYFRLGAIVSRNSCWEPFPLTAARSPAVYNRPICAGVPGDSSYRMTST